MPEKRPFSNLDIRHCTYEKNYLATLNGGSTRAFWGTGQPPPISLRNRLPCS